MQRLDTKGEKTTPYVYQPPAPKITNTNINERKQEVLEGEGACVCGCDWSDKNVVEFKRISAGWRQKKK